MTQLALKKQHAIARPLRELVPLIKEEIEAGDAAGIEHYRRAGEMLLEAKAQVPHGEWGAWVKRNFHVSGDTARYYMKLAGIEKPAAVGFSSVRQAVRPEASSKVSWQQPVQQIAAQVNVAALARDRQAKEKEQQLLRKLSHQLIDIGYKVLSSKLHPDKGGSAEAMARLNQVRKLLKEAI